MKTSPLNQFNLDSALRYRPIVEKLNKSKWNNFPVLEVGSGTNGISDFYDEKVIGVDRDFSKTAAIKNPNMEHKIGMAIDLPFNEGSFYQVVCVDTLEHISKKLRPYAIQEILRVTKKGGEIFLGFPTGNSSVKFDSIINSQFKKVHQRNHPWILEHQQFGLPDKEEILSLIGKEGVSRITTMKNVNLIVWFLIHLLFTVYDSSRLTKLLKLFYKPIFYLSQIRLPPYYRVILIIQK